MKIWQVVSAQNSMLVTPHDFEKDKDKLGNFNGNSLKERWSPFSVDIYRKGKGRDFSHILPGILLLTNKSMNILESLIERYVEFLPAENDLLEMTFINVKNVTDSIDYDRSTIDRYSDGEFREFTKIYFIEDKIKDVPIFKIPEKSTRIYVSDEFRDLVLQSKLKGLEFNLIWDSELTEEMELALERKYESMLADIERNKGPEFDWSEACIRVKAGKAVASGKWKLQAEANGNMLTGQLDGDGTYSWVDPIYIPPILLDLKWHEVEKSEF